MSDILDKVKERFPNISEDTLRINGLIPNGGARTAMPVALSKSLPTQQGVTAPNRSKYNAKRTEYNGISYPSKKEAKTAQEMDLQVKAGEIDFYLRQVNFNLPGGIVYRADFVTFKCSNGFELNQVNYSEWKIRVIEVKGFSTSTWKLKYRLFKETYPNLEIKII